MTRCPLENLLFRIKWHISQDHYSFICMEITSKLNFLQQCQKSALICSIFGLWIMQAAGELDTTSSSHPAEPREMQLQNPWKYKKKNLGPKWCPLVAIMNSALPLKILCEAFFLYRFTVQWNYCSETHYPTPQCQRKTQQSTKMLFWLFLNFGGRCRVINGG